MSQAISQLLESNDFDESMLKLENKIKELEPLIAAHTSIQNISRLETAAKSKAQLADAALLAAKQSAEEVTANAENAAKNTLQTATEKAEQITVLADNKLKQANTAAEEIKLDKVSLDKAKSAFNELERRLIKREQVVAKAETEIARQKAILEQL